MIGPTNKRLLLMGLDAPLGAWNDDEFWIVTKGKRLVLIGDGPFGALYAVYEFLEMRGFRFLAPDVAEDSKSPKLAVPPLDECSRPGVPGARRALLHAILQSDNDWAGAAALQ